MTTWLVTRHPGALEWLLAQGLNDISHVAHLDPATVSAGDAVVGTLPLHLVAQVCTAGARYFNLSLDVPEGMRGRELTADELTRCGARLEEYAVEKIAGTTSSSLPIPESGGTSGRYAIKLAEGSCLFVPAEVRAALGVSEGESFVGEVREGEFVLTTNRDQARAAARHFQSSCPPQPGGALADELIVEGRNDASREDLGS